MNSFRSVERAIAFEIERQAVALDAGEVLTQDTRGWDEDRGRTYVMRSKEDSHDYRYFPEPDLPPLRVDAELARRDPDALPELPADRRARYERDLGLSAYDAAVLVGEPRGERAVRGRPGGRARRSTPKAVANWVTGTWLGLLRSDPEAAGRVDPASWPIWSAGSRAASCPGRTPRRSSPRTPPTGRRSRRSSRRAGSARSRTRRPSARVVDEVVAANPKAVEDYRAGKPVLGFFVGQVMKATRGQANAALVQEAVRERLERATAGDAAR